jgi:hypothetical protein
LVVIFVVVLFELMIMGLECMSPSFRGGETEMETVGSVALLAGIGNSG